MARSWRYTGTAAAVLAAGATGAAAHDLWVLPASFRPRPASTVSLDVRVGEAFPVSMNAPASSLSRFAIVTADGETAITGAQPEGKALVARFEAPAAGTSAVVLEGPPRFIELTPEQFRGYLRHEGLGHIDEERTKRGEAGKKGLEDYSRHSKALLRSGPGKGVATRPLGLALELVPSEDPYDLAPGRPLPVTALFRGKPVAGLELRAYREGRKLDPVRTGPDGTASVTLDAPGVWCIAYIHMTRCGDCVKAEWRSYFGTLTFDLPAAP